MKYTILFFITISIVLSFTLAGAQADKDNSGLIQEEVIIGTDGDDTINSGDGNDNISAGKGNDTINGGDGNDLISGGEGNDKITDGAGDDYIMGGEGNDTVKVGDGNDYINLGPGDDTLVINMAEEIGSMNFADGGEGNDTVIIVIEDVNDLLRNDIIQYFDDKNKVGTQIVDMGNFNITAGLSNFEKVAVTARFTL
jgi:Ca2+-binding RTX toxin-like protein